MLQGVLEETKMFYSTDADNWTDTSSSGPYVHSSTPPIINENSSYYGSFFENLLENSAFDFDDDPFSSNNSYTNGSSPTMYSEKNCTNDYCVSDDEYIDMIANHIFPTKYEWALVTMHCVVFVVGLVGNALVCVAVYRNHSMRTVTNYFIVNLALADFMVILFCLPPSVVWDVTETWFMGTTLCKVVLYFQTVSVTVSVLTLTFISVDRWYAICFPLMFRSTTGRAKTAILVIWLLALCFDIPELIVLKTQGRSGLKVDTHYFTQCLPTWSNKSEMTFTVIKTVALYTVPLLFMTVAYCQIVKVLWRSDNIPGHTETRNHHSTSCNNALGSGRRNTINTTNANTTTEGQLRSRRKAAKMLVAVVVMFAVCYFPVHLLNILRYTMIIQQSDVMTAISSLSHWLCYANSAVNPVIYNFMSGKFRREFKRTILQCATSSRHSYHATMASDYPMSNTQGTLLLRGNTRRSNDTSRI